jgi:hypothetical protein
MQFFYCSFNEWKKLDNQTKNSYLFLSTAYSDPVYFTGFKFLPFVPNEDLHNDAKYDFINCNFWERYTQQINSLNKSAIIDTLKQFNENIIVFLFWEAENKKSERDIIFPWLTNCNSKDIKNFSFISFLKQKEIQENTNVFDI